LSTFVSFNTKSTTIGNYRHSTNSQRHHESNNKFRPILGFQPPRIESTITEDRDQNIYSDSNNKREGEQEVISKNLFLKKL